MTEREIEVKEAEFTVRANKIRAREAKIEMEEGYKVLRAKMESKYENLKASYEGALLDLEESELYLTSVKEKAEKKFD